ncbi:MAG: hypothetical protein CMJ81_12335 [Planctomycetaceae bacterium]|nr:hypothetical protein [Planctomycetaceae bacterium]MBP63532.1 hypothetical protein [Planctomycetaceae bacterium]
MHLRDIGDRDLQASNLLSLVAVTRPDHTKWGKSRDPTLTGVVSPVTVCREVCPTLVRVNTPGPTGTDMSSFADQYRRKPLFPFELS